MPRALPPNWFSIGRWLLDFETLRLCVPALSSLNRLTSYVGAGPIQVFPTTVTDSTHRVTSNERWRSRTHAHPDRFCCSESNQGTRVHLVPWLEVELATLGNCAHD